MKVIKPKDLPKKDYQRIVNRSSGTNQSIMPSVRKSWKKLENKVTK